MMPLRPIFSSPIPPSAQRQDSDAGKDHLLEQGRHVLVPVGDARQLPRVIQGAHANPTNLSCLEFLLGDHATVPPDRGFLTISRRTHPDTC
jgi:hypothetical protein